MIMVQKSFHHNQSIESGKLYLVATPIGNLEDMTFRAVNILKEVDLIAAEDTRNTRKLLTHFDIKTKCVSYHEHNKEASGPELVRLLLEGKHIALVSDAGLPAISDPGQELVQLSIENSISVIPVPGANAALSALIVSGMSTNTFTFIGFLSREKKYAMQQLEPYKAVRESLIFYESPHRLKKTLDILLEVFGDRKVAFARELTKKHEEIVRGNITELIGWYEEHDPIGEYCIVLEGLDEAGQTKIEEEANAWWQQLTLDEHVSHYEVSMSRKDAIKKVAQDRSLAKRDVYNEVNR